MYPIVVLISGNGSNLQAIIDASNKGAAYCIKAVISDKADAYGLERARRANIPTEVISAKGYVNRAAYDQALEKIITHYEPQLIVLAGFMRILSPEFVRHFAGRIINIHPSLLPKYPGLDTHKRALEAGDKEHGVTIHYVTEELDAGPIIAQEKIIIAADDTSESLKQRVHELEHKLYPAIIQQFAEGQLPNK